MGDKVKARVGDLFPANDERSPWMFRLAVLRDDVDYEVKTLFSLRHDSSTADSWRTVYHLRRLTVTILEARDIFRAQVQPWVGRNKRDPGKVPPKMKKLVDFVVRKLVDAELYLEPIRNGLGGHVKPRSAHHGTAVVDTVEATVLENHKDTVTTMIVSDDGESTAFHDLTTHALIWVWADVTTDQQYADKHWHLHQILLCCASSIRQAADELLLGFWRERGLVA